MNSFLYRKHKPSRFNGVNIGVLSKCECFIKHYCLLNFRLIRLILSHIVFKNAKAVSRLELLFHFFSFTDNTTSLYDNILKDQFLFPHRYNGAGVGNPNRHEQMLRRLAKCKYIITTIHGNKCFKYTTVRNILYSMSYTPALYPVNHVYVSFYMEQAPWQTHTGRDPNFSVSLFRSFPYYLFTFFRILCLSSSLRQTRNTFKVCSKILSGLI